jgi:hypothetical protein
MKYMDTRHAVFFECDASSTPREIDLEEIWDYVPPPMIHDYISTIVVAPHMKNVPSSENTGATPKIIENDDVPIEDEQQAKKSGANETPLDNEQEVEPEQPQEEINEPPLVRRSQRERKSVISKDYVVGTLKTRYPRVQVPGQDRRRDMQITRSYVRLTSA